MATRLTEITDYRSDRSLFDQLQPSVLHTDNMPGGLRHLRFKPLKTEKGTFIITVYLFQATHLLTPSTATPFSRTLMYVIREEDFPSKREITEQRDPIPHDSKNNHHHIVWFRKDTDPFIQDFSPVMQEEGESKSGSAPQLMTKEQLREKIDDCFRNILRQNP